MNIRPDAVLMDVVDSKKDQLSNKSKTFPECGVQNNTLATAGQELDFFKASKSHKGGQFEKNLLENYKIFF